MKFRKNNSKLIGKLYYVEFLLDQQYAYIKYKGKMHFFDKESQKNILLQGDFKWKIY